MNSTVDEINEVFGHDLRITMVIPTMYDKRIKSSIQTLSEIRKGFNGTVASPIRVNSKLKEAPSQGTTIFDHAKSSNGAKDYLKLTEKVIETETGF